jgi:hypothetical protein
MLSGTAEKEPIACSDVEERADPFQEIVILSEGRHWRSQWLAQSKDPIPADTTTGFCKEFRRCIVCAMLLHQVNEIAIRELLPTWEWVCTGSKFGRI